MPSVWNKSAENPLCLKRDQLLSALPDRRQAAGGPVIKPLTQGRLAEITGGDGREDEKIAVIARNRRKRNVIEPKQALDGDQHEGTASSREFLSKNLGNERKQTSGKRSE